VPGFVKPSLFLCYFFLPPPLMLGFSALLAYSSASKARETVRKISLNGILVETDASYSLPSQVRKRALEGCTCQHSHSGLALHAVKEIAHLKSLLLSLVLPALQQNTRHMYDLQELSRKCC
uniref:Uncharacterized protein n=1 Tax=Apteryx owenii TaxID=8824 RepID=A0A8B9QJ37_APTOW